jgi:hypothetical protein
VGFDITPTFVSFDMNGTLIHYRQDETIRNDLGDRLPAEIVDDVELAAEQIRFDECMGAWRPMHEVIDAALRRTMAKFGLEYREGDGRAVYEQIPTWRPYPRARPSASSSSMRTPSGAPGPTSRTSSRARRTTTSSPPTSPSAAPNKEN